MIDPMLHDAIEQFYFAYRAFTVRADLTLEQRGLGRVHHRLLYFVGRNPGISVNGLLAILCISKQALHAPLRRLVEDGLIDVATVERDRRQKALSLSAAGRLLETTLTQAQMAHLQLAFAQAGPDAGANWLQTMTAIAATAPYVDN